MRSLNDSKLYWSPCVSWCMFMGKCVNFIGIFSLPSIVRREKNVNATAISRWSLRNWSHVGCFVPFVTYRVTFHVRMDRKNRSPFFFLRNSRAKKSKIRWICLRYVKEGQQTEPNSLFIRHQMMTIQVSSSVKGLRVQWAHYSRNL